MEQTQKDEHKRKAARKDELSISAGLNHKPSNQEKNSWPQEILHFAHLNLNLNPIIDGLCRSVCLDFYLSFESVRGCGCPSNAFDLSAQNRSTAHWRAP